MTTAINSKNVLRAQYGGTDLTGVRKNHVEVRGIGRTVFLRDSCYARTNHFIKETQPYSTSTLHRFWYFPCARWFFLACAVVSLASVATLYIAAPLAVVMLVWLVILCQHCVVSCCTIPRVLRQPVIVGQQKLNQLYEVRVEQLTGVLLQAHEAGIGYVEARTGMVKLQTFSPRAVGHMQRARVYSMIMFMIAFVLFLYSAGSAAGLGWNKYSDQISKKYCESLKYDCVSCLNGTAKTINILFIHYEIQCAFTLESGVECLGGCGVLEDGSEDYAERAYTHVSSCEHECVSDAKQLMDCTKDQADRVCGVEQQYN
ncbi:hypothetical protein LOD99_14149 [Oopsacas minuta]|uniref:Uncharacterized protein n=1 Tax=Oopsacas minuta TaxID=111878 RepID=A0AAV7KIL5_9METZ|nr:hypothetical protein LOD99_14149 [Oopsacas minuta]